MVLSKDFFVRYYVQNRRLITRKILIQWNNPKDFKPFSHLTADERRYTPRKSKSKSHLGVDQNHQALG